MSLDIYPSNYKNMSDDALLQEMFGEEKKATLVTKIMSRINDPFNEKGFKHAIKAFNESLFESATGVNQSINKTFTDVTNTLVWTFSSMLVAIYIPMFILILVLLWLMVSAGMITWLVALVITIVFFIFILISWYLFRSYITVYVGQQRKVIRQDVNTMVQTTITALPSAVSAGVDAYISNS